jgi:hypothetical protein
MEEKEHLGVDRIRRVCAAGIDDRPVRRPKQFQSVFFYPLADLFERLLGFFLNGLDWKMARKGFEKLL